MNFRKGYIVQIGVTPDTQLVKPELLHSYWHQLVAMKNRKKSSKPPRLPRIYHLAITSLISSNIYDLMRLDLLWTISETWSTGLLLKPTFPQPVQQWLAMLQCLNIGSDIVLIIFKFFNRCFPLFGAKLKVQGEPKFFQGKEQIASNRVFCCLLRSGVSGNAVISGSTCSSLREKKGMNSTGSQECGKSFYITETVVPPRLRKAKEKFEGSGWTFVHNFLM